jgi:predicted phosphodiesterase
VFCLTAREISVRRFTERFEHRERHWCFEDEQRLERLRAGEPDVAWERGKPLSLDLPSLVVDTTDIHGNLAAVSAVQAALTTEEPLDAVLVAGDLLQGGLRPREEWQTLADNRWILVQGNEDAVIAGLLPPTLDPGHPYQKPYLARHKWSLSQIDAFIQRALGELPREFRVTTPAGDLLVVHASPRGLDDRAGGPHNTAAEVATSFDGTGASAIAFGHWHQSFVRPTPFALLLNVASVSQPRDCRSLAAYTIITASSTGWIVEQRCVPYDVDEEERAARSRGMPPWSPA